MNNSKNQTEAPKNKRTVCVIGHKNPDTDSICSAISYAYLKNQIDPNHHYVACRAGTPNPETMYVLEYFHVELPTFLDNIGTRVKDMEIREVPGVRSDISVLDAWNLMRSQNVFTLPITDEEDHLHGLITTNDIAKSYMEEHDASIVSMAKTPYRNILKTLEGTMLVGDESANFEKGKVLIAAANPDVMEHYIEENDMVILGNRYEGQLCAIEMNAGCIVVCLGTPVSRTIQHMAKEHGCTVISTPLDTYAVARLINQSMPVEYFMKKDNLITFHKHDFTEDIREVMSSKRYRDFPIENSQGSYIGMISRRNLLGVHKRLVILVDHNEISQAVNNIEDAEIREIIDHHRLGSMETMNPVYFRNQPVGCTATIVYQMFQENGVEIPQHIAGLLCSAILSDTLMFRSPTCTKLDQQTALALAQIAGIDCEKHAHDMFVAGSDLENKTPEEIFYQDFKKFEFDDRVLGIGQINSMDQGELDTIKDRMLPYLQEAYEKQDMDMMVFMLTNIIEETTEMLCFGEDAAKLVEDAFRPVKVVDNVARVKGIVSRKKQVVPALMSAITRNAMGEV
ncbi:MAG: putative manganese-dependent inorganic diphosphatase [Lachnospiraceae bacterium]|nr:putative manganese-dependent inorganic diphosphatase [Lachnospiraceae bacterium]